MKSRLTRDSNMELLRIISMILVLGLHANNKALGDPSPIDFQADFIQSGFRVFLQQFCMVCVNIFVLISGWFSIKATLKGAVKLLFQVLFFEVIVLAISAIQGDAVSTEQIVKTFIIGSDYWFVPAYLILYCISPALNRLIEQESAPKVKAVIIGYFAIQFIYGYLFADMARFGYGYSALSFIGLYLLARYVRVHSGRLFSLAISLDMLIILSTTLLTSILSVVLISTDMHFLGVSVIAPQATFNNPLVVLSSLYWVVLFSKLNVRSTIINWAGRSAFAIYLLHCHPLVFPWFLSKAQSLYQAYSGVSYFLLLFLFFFIISTISIILDQPRILLWDSILSRFAKEKNESASIT